MGRRFFCAEFLKSDLGLVSGMVICFYLVVCSGLWASSNLKGVWSGVIIDMPCLILKVRLLVFRAFESINCISGFLWIRFTLI